MDDTLKFDPKKTDVTSRNAEYSFYSWTKKLERSEKKNVSEKIEKESRVFVSQRIVS